MSVVRPFGAFPTRAVITCAAALILGACATKAESRSPWTTGFGVKIAPAFETAEDGSGPTIHPMLSYTRMGGSANWFEVGGQVRWPLAMGDRQLWAGAEASVGRIGSSNGFLVSALFGVPVGDSRWQPSLFASAGLSRYGATGKVVSAGIDVQPWFFRR